MRAAPSKLLTVVIPAYNAARYIGECLRSIILQPLSKSVLEIIVVIDGATDTTALEVEKATQGYEGAIQTIVQENFGLSAARNEGILHTTTQYVTFLDADDVWLPDYLEIIVPLLSSSADLIEYDAIKIDTNGKLLSELKISSAAPRTQTLSSPNDFALMFQCYAWARVYGTHLIRAHPFPPGRRFEDTATTPWVHWSSGMTISLGHTLIGYRQHAQSIIKTPREQDIRDIAMTTAEAAFMFSRTKSAYWQLVAHRSFQQGCSRTILQPVISWPKLSRRLRASVAAVPVPDGIMRRLQLHVTLLYLVLLFCARKLRHD